MASRPLQLVAAPLLLLLLVVVPAARSSRVFSVADYGAAGDGSRYDTAAIQAAVDACAAAGGGRVLLPAPGNYLTATVHLRSRVVLDVAPGARLLGGTRQEDYPAVSSRWYVVLAESTTGAGVTGGGEINGQGGAFVVTPSEVKNIMVYLGKLIRLGTCIACSLHLVRCDNTVIHNVSIFGDFNTPNNDGMDIEDSNNTVITNCHIDTGDDALCPKSSTGPVYNLTATNCWIRTKSCAIKFGSASYFDFKRLVFDNITIVDSHRGLGMQIRDGGNVSDVVFSNIKMSTRYYHPLWWGRAEPIYITTCPRHPDSKEGTISDLRFINISSVSENGVFLAGSKHGLLHNLKFKNIDLTYKRWTNYTGGLYDYRPGCQKMVKHKTGGMMLEHISGLEVDNVRMRWARGSLKGWDVNPLLFRPSTIDQLSFHDWQSVDVQ
ncbi:hypothetical protein HU200_037931 [Digitaria exilis]|uniref:Pectate lyase superfamily protein domain-containing protein n=1 Tax=Digitaria exilis TaxID=1010633 RepID=A0A835BAW9_9POAL|nr:hypothetical protein HU200_037931 [Digitaria exilis]